MLAAGLLAACQPPAPQKAEAQADPLADALAPRTAVIATTVPFVNEEFGIRAVFPANSRVCEALSGAHPEGFYTRVGDPRMSCAPSRDPPKVSAMVVLGNYNAAFHETMEEVVGPDCPKLNPVEADGRQLGFPGFGSTVCESRTSDGGLEVSVHAFAGSWEDEPGHAVPRLIYSAYLSSTTRTEAADRAAFQRFLDQVVLTPPEDDEYEANRCVWTRGVLVAANGTPSLRLRTGGRVLGVTSPNGTEAPDALPANAWTALRSRGDVFGTEVSGEWRVCPWREDQPGAMRPVRIAEARDLTVTIR